MPITAKRNHIKKRASTLIVALILLGTMFFFQETLKTYLGDYFIYPFIAVVIFSILLDVIEYLRYSTTSVEVSDKAFVYRTGILTKREITYPFYKISNTRTQVTIGDRIFGTKTLMIDTAGESDLDLIVEDLPAKACDAIYSEINGKMGKIKLVKGNDDE
ncbi:MAG: PH domain-containing protein [Candidatus Micrarchaeota archaeon]|nr:PH domain-containing protein [Candidatus Micrarchaeota archaeon]